MDLLPKRLSAAVEHKCAPFPRCHLQNLCSIRLLYIQFQQIGLKMECKLIQIHIYLLRHLQPRNCIHPERLVDALVCRRFHPPLEIPNLVCIHLHHPHALHQRQQPQCHNCNY